MYYHASPIKDITRLEPRVSNHGIPLIYFSKKRENVLVYLSNAIEKYCRDTGFSYDGKWEKWGPYGFDKDGRQRLEEYYPNALMNTYKGVSGFIYSVETIVESDFALQIPDAAYEAILQAERNGLITILRYEEMSEAMREWNARTIKEEYEKAVDHPEYRHFLRGNFPDMIKE